MKNNRTLENLLTAIVAGGVLIFILAIKLAIFAGLIWVAAKIIKAVLGL